MTIVDLIRYHTQLQARMDWLYDQGGDGAVAGLAYRTLAEEALKLEYLVLAMRATSEADVSAKRAFMDQLEEIDLGRLLSAIFELDSTVSAAAA